jgi:serine/threonine protein kinase/DNA polymerase III delta prime subunit
MCYHMCGILDRKLRASLDTSPLSIRVFLVRKETLSMAERVGQILGNYQLLRLLGRGAFAEVYLAEHRYLEVPAAIKVLHVRMEPDTQKQFLREARTIAHLQHPHIIRVHDFGFQNQTPFLVMEYTPNGTLRTRHPKGTRLPLEQIVHYVKQLAPALDYAHQQRVIHRDIKPENMLLSTNNQVVLSDFGLAVVQQSLDSLATQSQAGTPLYMAPEQIRGKPSAASDQYALGVLVYEWLCGEPPFRGSIFEVWSQHLYQPPPSLCARIPFLPPAVEEAVFGALAKEPQARFTRVQDFAEVLEEACDATAPLLLRVSLEQLSQERVALADTFPLTIVAPAPEEPDQPTPTTQLLALAPKPAADREERRTSAQHPTVPLWQTNRQRLLRKVRAYWITGVLEHSLHGNALVALGLQEQPAAVAHPWQLVLHHPVGVPRPLPVGTRITEVYDGAAGELLILGAPGSGKTTLLLEIARALLERAERDEQHPLPVVFNLSSWAMKQQRLVDWLVEELASTYQVPRKLGQTLVETDQILLLLDGLDEVAPKDRTACIEAINTYRQEHGLLPLVVCSRSADYLVQAARVQLGCAVVVQPLTEQQVDAYLAWGGEPLRALRAAWRKDAALRELTSTPLMLSILALTYHGLPVEELLRGASLTERQRQIFAHYVERMLRHRGTETSYTSEQTKHWLAWLARQMKQQNQTVFYIEHLQPDWLSGERMRRAYNRWALRFPAILMGMLVSLAINMLLAPAAVPSLSVLALSLAPFMVLGGFIGWLLDTGSTIQHPHENSRKASRGSWSRLVERLRVGIPVGLIFGLAAGLTFGLSSGLISGLSAMLLQAALEKSNRAASSFHVPHTARKPRWQNLLKHVGIRNGILVGLIVGLSSGLTSGLGYGLGAGLLNGLISGLSAGLFSGLLSMLLIGKPVGITLTDELVWSWRSLGRSLFAKRHLSTTLRVMVSTLLIVALASVLSTGLRYVLHDGLAAGLSVGLSFWLLLGLFQGVSSETIEDQHRVVPNQGIRHSARNSLILGLISTGIAGLAAGLAYGLAYGLIDGLISGLSYGLSVGLIIGLSAGLLAGLLYGGLACLRHGVVRLLLWRAGSMPWNYPHFLDSAAERILLRKVGGGYIFVHRLLLEYFASLDSTPIHDEARAQTQQTQPVP